MNNVIRDFLTCPITRTRLVEPFETNCGHLFSFEAISVWWVRNRNCPICRTILTIDDIRPALSIERLINSIELPEDESHEISTQTTQNQQSVSIQADGPEERRPFVSLQNQAVSIGELTIKDQEYIKNDKIVDLANGLFNPASQNAHIGPVVDRINQQYVSKLITKACDHPMIVIRKFAYQTHELSLVSVARNLALNGYFVYDLFRANNKQPYTYVLYSTDILVDGKKNELCRYTRSNPALSD